MHILKFAKTYDNNIFTQYGLSPVVEDYFTIKDNIFCIADGVTRDSIYANAVPYPKNKKEAKTWINVYPNPSGAYEAAKICADSFIEHILEAKNNEDISKEIILEAIKKSNKKIWQINKNRKIDYLANDLFCCVAVGGYISKDFLYCFSIGDCHITVLNNEFDIIFESINNHLNFENYLFNEYCKNNKYDWNNPKDRVMVRKDYRNNPDKKVDGKEVSFGVLSGEKTSEYYIDVYKVPLDNAKYICAYSDGCEPFFQDKDKLKEIIKNPNTLEKEGKERTLIIFEKE